MLAQFEKEVASLLQWETQAEKPNLSEIEEVVLAARQGPGPILANELIENRLESEAALSVDPQTGKRMQPKGKTKGST